MVDDGPQGGYKYLKRERTLDDMQKEAMPAELRPGGGHYDYEFEYEKYEAKTT